MLHHKKRHTVDLIHLEAKPLVSKSRFRSLDADPMQAAKDQFWPHAGPKKSKSAFSFFHGIYITDTHMLTENDGFRNCVWDCLSNLSFTLSLWPFCLVKLRLQSGTSEAFRDLLGSGSHFERCLGQAAGGFGPELSSDNHQWQRIQSTLHFQWFSTGW